MDCEYEKPRIERVKVRTKKVVLSAPEYSESSWTGRSCFKICRTKKREEKN